MVKINNNGNTVLFIKENHQVMIKKNFDKTGYRPIKEENYNTKQKII